MEIRVLRRLEDKSKADAEEIQTLLGGHGVALLNIMGGPGCGKTTLLEHLLPKLGERLRCAVLEGDLFTTRDSERIAALGAIVIQLETQGSCHLDATLVLRGLRELPLSDLRLVMVENVGNLVCPASFDLGETARLAVVSVTEGDDKPSKYPLVFARANAVVISKTDLLEHTDFDTAAAERDIRRFNADVPLFTFNHRDGPSRPLVDWLYALCT